MSVKPVVILGGGIAGLGASFALGKDRATIFEARKSAGGLCDNFVVDGFRFDYAVHLSFTTSAEVRAIFDKTPFFVHKPEALNFYQNLWIKHPVQNNLFPLPVENKVRAISDFLNRPARSSDHIAPGDYGEWLYSNYGNYITDEFYNRYTRKYWCEESSNMDTSWISNRMYCPKTEEVLYGAMSAETPNCYYASEMRYPVRGGYKAFIEPLVREADVRLNKEAVAVDLKKKTVGFADGSVEHFETLVSSLPMIELVSIIKDIPKKIEEASKQLEAASLVITSIVFKRENVPNALWFYIYDEDIYPARAHSPSWKSKDNVRPGFSSLQFETYFSRKRPLKCDVDNLSGHIVEKLQAMNICRKDEIHLVDSRLIKYANAIFNKKLLTNRKIVREYLDQSGVFSIGRFGEWDYFWSDQSLLSGINAGKRILKGIL